jgi:hypothetical protein
MTGADEAHGRANMRNNERHLDLGSKREGITRRTLMNYAGAAALVAGGGFGAAFPASAKTRFVFANESDYDTVDPHAACDPPERL